MTRFRVDDMSCAHCVRTITDAVAAVDPAATVRADLASHMVEIDGDAAPAVLAQALRAAGYEAVAA